MGIIDHAPRSLSAVALGARRVAVIDEDAASCSSSRETPMFAIQVMQSLATRIRQLDNAG